MRILHVLAQLPTRTGSGIYSSNVLYGLQRLGHDCAFVYGVQEPFNFDFEADGIQTYPLKFKDEVSFPIAGMSDEMPYDNTVYSQMTPEMIEEWTAAYRERLETAKSDFQPDLVITHHLWMLSKLVLEVFPEVPVLAFSHGTDIRQAEQNPVMKDRYVGNFDQADVVFALSHHDIPTIESIFGVDPAKIVVMSGGFDSRLFYDEGVRDSGAPVHIMYGGKLSHAKGIFELAKAFPQVAASYPGTTLRLVGSASDSEQAELYANAKHADGFEIVDAESQAAFAAELRSSDIFVLPSYFEGLGLVAIEALASGCRVVATEIDGLIELLGDEVNQSGLIEYIELPRLYDADKPVEADLPDFVDRLAAALKLQVERVQDGVTAPDRIHAQIKNHSWDSLIDHVNELILEITK